MAWQLSGFAGAGRSWRLVRHRYAEKSASLGEVRTEEPNQSLPLSDLHARVVHGDKVNPSPGGGGNDSGPGFLRFKNSGNPDRTIDISAEHRFDRNIGDRYRLARKRRQRY
jgi:hypothetical protein